MNLNDFEEFLEFNKRQINIIKIKEAKYQDNWKTCHISTIFAKIDYQIDKLTKSLEKIASTTKSLPQATINARNTLLDISNYCFFLHKRLGDKN